MTAGPEEQSGLTALAGGLSAPKGLVDASPAAPAPGTILLGGFPAPAVLPVAAIGRASAQL